MKVHQLEELYKDNVSRLKEQMKKQEKERSGSRSLSVVRDIRAGEKLTPENIRSIRPGHGLHTMYYEEVLGKTAQQDIERGTPLAWGMFR